MLRCCLIHITVILPWRILYLVYLCQYNWPYNFINTNPLVFCTFFYNIVYHFGVITWMKEANNFQIANIELPLMLSFCLILAIFSLLLLIKVFLIKKRVEHVCCGVCICNKWIRSPIWISTNVKNAFLSESSGRQLKRFSVKTFRYICDVIHSVKRMFWAILVMITPMQMEFC